MSETKEHVQKENENTQKEHDYSLIKMVLVIGFVGGIGFSVIAYLAYYFHFIKIEPNVLFEPFTVGNWRQTWIGMILVIFVYGLLGVLFSIIYYLFLRRQPSIWTSIIYGIVIYFFVMIIMNPIFPSVKPFMQNDKDTLITLFCIFTLFGMFIGYSISFEYQEIKYNRENKIT